MTTFLVLAEELHFGKTAARLHLTAGRVSQTIRALEREVGGALFERTSRTVRLTPLGARFRDGARCGYDQLHGTLRECQRAARGARVELRISFLPSIGPWVTQIAEALEEVHPDCVVRLGALVNFDLVPHGFDVPEDSDLTLAWCPGGDGSAMTAAGRTVGPVLRRSPRGVVVPVGHPLAGRTSISVEDLAGHVLLNPCRHWRPELLDAWTPATTPSGRPLHRLAEDVPTMTGRRELIVDDFLTLVSRGQGLHVTVATALDRLSRPDLEVVPIHDLPPMVVVPVWRTGAEHPAIPAFLATARSLSAGNRSVSR